MGTLLDDFPIKREEFLDLSPADVMLQLRWLSREIMKAQKDTAELEVEYAEAEARHTVAMARSRITIGNSSRPDGKNYTEQQKEDMAIAENEESFFSVSVLQAKVKAIRSRNNALITESDIVRSVSSLMKTEVSSGN